ncbi:hypothetical protein DOE51_10380 [Bdellovibrio sp. NC01]|nr:hypothetical protein DOE51_10380 [Bdellovibrio sp. NC01]
MAHFAFRFSDHKATPASVSLSCLLAAGLFRKSSKLRQWNFISPRPGKLGAYPAGGKYLFLQYKEQFMASIDKYTKKVYKEGVK